MKFRLRALVLLGLFVVGLGIVWARVFSLQVLSRERWLDEAERSRSRVVRVEAPRGRILDADGVPLAEDRPSVQLAFVAAEWETRERWRCPDCGAGSFPRARGKGPGRCACGAPASRLVPIGPGDLAPLERDMGLPPGSLAREAEEAVRDLEAIIRSQVARLDPEEAQVDDLLRLVRDDYFRRERPMTWFGEGKKKTISRPHLPDAALRRLALDFDGAFRGFRAVQATERRYPQDALLAACVGFTQGATDEQVAASARVGGEDGPPVVARTTRVGATGLERFYDPALRGTPGLLEVERGDDGAFSERHVRIQPRPGQDVRLSLRVAAIREAQRVLEAHATSAGYAPGGPASGGFVMIDAETGAILAWADTPTFDLNGDLREIYARLGEEEAAKAAAAVAAGATPPAETAGDEAPRFTTKATPYPVAYSRVAEIPVEPGSSLKLVTAITLLLSGGPLPAHYACAGPSRSLNDKPGCSHDHPAVDVEDAIAFSCNRFFASLAGDLSRAKEHRELFPRVARLIGLGEPTGLDLPRARRGTYPKTVDPTELRFLAIGQGRVLTTPLHMARICAAVATGGRAPRPRLAASVGGVAAAPEATDVGIPPSSLARVREGMRRALSEEGGTAHRAFQAAKGVPGLEGVTVYGKTGTAQVGGKMWDPAAIEEGPWHHWFVGYATKPGARTVAFALVLHARTEKAGGLTAAPAVLEYLAWWFGSGAAR